MSRGLPSACGAAPRAQLQHPCVHFWRLLFRAAHGQPLAACRPCSPPRPPAAAGRYSRYKQQVGSGRFKVVYKGFDEKQGIDVAWSKIEADPNGLSHDQMKSIVDEISYGLGLDHPHVIKVRRGAWGRASGRAGQGR